MRVLVLTNMWPSPERPASGAFAAVQVRSVRDAGVDVDLAVVAGHRSRFAYVRAALWMLRLNFMRRRYDLVHAHTGHCGLLARLQWRYPVLVSYVGYDLNGVRRADGRLTLKSRLERAVFRQLPRVGVATVTKSARLGRQLPPRYRSRNVVLPNGVDRSRFRPIARDVARADLGWPLDELVVLFTGDPTTVGKRFPLASTAVEVASKRMNGIRLRVCTGIEHGTVATVMNAADVLVLTSVAEGSPNVVKEALACNLPVVATDVGDVSEVVEGIRRCAVVPIDVDSSDLADALIDVLRDAPERNDGREKTSHLAADLIARRLIQIYWHVAARAPTRAREPAAVAIRRST